MSNVLKVYEIQRNCVDHLPKTPHPSSNTDNMTKRIENKTPILCKEKKKVDPKLKPWINIEV